MPPSLLSVAEGGGEACCSTAYTGWVRGVRVAAGNSPSLQGGWVGRRTEKRAGVRGWVFMCLLLAAPAGPNPAHPSHHRETSSLQGYTAPSVTSEPRMSLGTVTVSPALKVLAYITR